MIPVKYLPYNAWHILSVQFVLQEQAAQGRILALQPNSIFVSVK